MLLFLSHILTDIFLLNLSPREIFATWADNATEVESERAPRGSLPTKQPHVRRRVQTKPNTNSTILTPSHHSFTSSTQIYKMMTLGNSLRCDTKVGSRFLISPPTFEKLPLASTDTLRLMWNNIKTWGREWSVIHSAMEPHIHHWDKLRDQMLQFLSHIPKPWPWPINRNLVVSSYLWIRHPRQKSSQEKKSLNVDGDNSPMLNPKYNSKHSKFPSFLKFKNFDILKFQKSSVQKKFLSRMMEIQNCIFRHKLTSCSVTPSSSNTVTCPVLDRRLWWKECYSFHFISILMLPKLCSKKCNLLKQVIWINISLYSITV